MIDKLSIYHNQKPNKKFDINVYKEVKLYQWISSSDPYRKTEEIYYNNYQNNYKVITHNYTYSVGCVQLIIHINTSSWTPNTFHIMHDSTDDDHTWRICNIPFVELKNKEEHLMIVSDEIDLTKIPDSESENDVRLNTYIVKVGNEGICCICYGKYDGTIEVFTDYIIV